MAGSGDAGEPAAKKARTEPYVWLQVKGGGSAIKIRTPGHDDVGELLEQVKVKVKPRLDHVAVDDLTLYPSVEAHSTGSEAIEVDRQLSELAGGETKGTALYVHYDVPAPAVAAPAAPAVQAVTAGDLDIGACIRPPSVDLNRTGFVKLDECVNKCMAKVKEWQPQKTKADKPRVPPVMLSRCMRGGKTTVLCKVFDELKKSGRNPIFISFNGDSIIKRLKDETPLNTMLRALAVALMKDGPKNIDEASRVRCEKHTLLVTLGDKDVVLIIDELNVLLKPSETEDYEEVGVFLRTTFLDPVGRHLVFSTHVPSIVGIDKLLGKGTGSTRDAIAVPMPTSRSIAELRGMHERCDVLTPCEAAYYSYVPSLIYTVKTEQDYYFHSRFEDIQKPARNDELLATFLTEFFDGTREDAHGPIRAFDSLTEFSEGRVRWVLGYAGLVSRHLHLNMVAEQVADLTVYAKTDGSGKDWELITNIALALRCFAAQYSEPHAILGLPTGAKPHFVYTRPIPAEHDTPDRALDWWVREEGAGSIKYPYLALLCPTHSDFETFDCVTVFRETNGGPQHVRGYQNKLSKGLPKTDAPEGMPGVLLRGDALGRSTGSKQLARWQYLNKQELTNFLGTSLEHVYPAEWPRIERPEGTT